MLQNAYTPKINDEIIDEILHRLHLIHGFSKINGSETYAATGINIDYLLTLRMVEGRLVLDQFPIAKLFSEIFARVTQILTSQEINSTQTLQNYISGCSLIDISEKLYQETRNELLNYCIKLDSRYLPDVHTLIGNKLKSLQERLINAEQLYRKGAYKQYCEKQSILQSQNPHRIRYTTVTDPITERDVYQQVITNLNKDFANYILVWLHAYRISTAIRECRNQGGIVAFSHRYKGWALPEHQVNSNFRLSFRTNFGYGRSSHFFILLNYKGVQIFPFMDWLNYQFVEVSQLARYSKMIHEWETVEKSYESQGKTTTYSKEEVVIKQEFWQTAMDYILEAANMAITDENAFIIKYIVEPIENLVNELNSLLSDDSESIVLTYPKFNENFELKSLDEEGKLLFKKLYLMDVKAEKISGALQFIDEFRKLILIIENPELYVKRVESINQQLRPLLDNYLPQANGLAIKLNDSMQELRLKLASIYQGTDSMVGLKIMQQEKSKMSSQDFNKKYPKFDELKKEHENLSESKNKSEQEFKFITKLVNNIRRYINNMEKYFSNT